MDENLKRVKMYSDFKSPYAFLAFDPAFALEEKYRIKLVWKPFQLRLKGKGQRSQYSEYKVKYSYMDARRWANMRGGLMIRGPLKIFDTTPALIGGLYAEKHHKLRAYGNKVFDLFFKRELAADEADAIAPVIESLGMSAQGYRDHLAGEGAADYERAQEEAVTDQVFGVPMFYFESEPFWGYDRMGLLEQRLTEAGLKIGEPLKQRADAAMLDLYFWTTPNGYKVTILLEELGLGYNVVPVHIGKGEQFNPEFLKISPNNKIPALIDHEAPDGKLIALFESGAIMMYLAEKTGWRFMPPDPRRRYDVVQWLMFQMGGVGPMLGQVHHFRRYAKEKNAYAIERYTSEATRLYRVLDTRLGQSEYLAGEYSIADMAVYPWLRPYKWQGQDIAAWPNLQRWYTAVRARPAVQRGLLVLSDRLERNKEKPTGESWDVLFGRGQFGAH